VGEATDEQVDSCTRCYLSGKEQSPLRLMQMRGVLAALAADGKTVGVDGREIPAHEALAMFNQRPGAFDLSAGVTSIS